jgi:hypothetical protein
LDRHAATANPSAIATPYGLPPFTATVAAAMFGVTRSTADHTSPSHTVPTSTVRTGCAASALVTAIFEPGPPITAASP